MSEAENIKPGYKHTSFGWIPEDWDTKTFEDVADIDKKSLNGNTAEDYVFDYISLSDVDTADFKMEMKKQVFKTAPSRARRIVGKNDILMSTVRPNLQGFLIIKNDVKDLIASTGFAVITATKCNNEFLFHSLFGSTISKQFYQLLVGSNYPAINSSDVRKLKLAFPEYKEQAAIANLLTTWDEAIQKLTVLTTQKEMRKKWLMQQLLTGKKRLKGFDDEWRERAVDEILIHTSRPVAKPASSYLALGIRSHGKGTFLKHDFEPAKIEMDTLFVVKENDLIVNITFAWEGAIAIVGKRDDGALVSHRFPTFVFNSQTSVINFFRHIILQPKFKYLLDLISPGGAGRNRVLSVKDFLKLRITIPSIEEQTAIAAVLQSANREIQLLKNKLEKLKEQKKGLMQILLTGKKRLKY